MVPSNTSNIADYLTITIGFDCNNSCKACMLKGIRSKLKPVCFSRFKEILEENKKTKEYRSLILSGAEVTLMESLPEYIQFAKSLEIFEHIRLQTNGRRLSDLEYCRSLIECGVDEFFISLFGADESTHDELTGVKGSFAETINGIRNLEAGCSVITNTVITSLNYKCLPEIPDMLSEFTNVSAIELWNYWAMDTKDKYGLMESNRNIKDFILKAIERGEGINIPVTIKGFPACLLGRYMHNLDNSMAYTIIDDLFWENYRLNEFRQCKFSSTCKISQCTGLSSAYIRKFGWDTDILKAPLI